MKAAVAVIFLIVSRAIISGQGSVNFSAGASAYTRISTNDWSGSPGYIGGSPAAAGQFYFALFVAPSTVTACPSLDPTLSGFTFTGYYGTNTSTLGRMTGNPTTDDAIINGYPTGSSASFMVLGWSANITPNGPDWGEVQAWWANGSPTGSGGTGWGFIGESAVATGVQLGGGAIAPGNIFGGNPGQIPGFSLSAPLIPEPSSLGLSLLALTIALAFHKWTWADRRGSLAGRDQNMSVTRKSRGH